MLKFSFDVKAYAYLGEPPFFGDNVIIIFLVLNNPLDHKLHPILM
jgi:hypothetical protein